MGDNIDFVCSYEHNYCQNCLLHSKSTERGGTDKNLDLDLLEIRRYDSYVFI